MSRSFSNITVKGAVMSPRMARLWRYIREERGMDYLCDWSTDVDVQRSQVALAAGEVELARRASVDPDNRDLRNLLIDYRTIMNRTPHGRVDAASLAAEEKRTLAARGKIEGTDSIGEQIAKTRW